MKKILVVGSSNMDIVVKVSRFPKPGETTIGNDYFRNQGGKGANQAIAVSRLGGDIDFLCKVGDDSIGEEMIDLFRAEGMTNEFVIRDTEAASGIAVITVDEHGENNIVVIPGANGNLSCTDIDNSVEAVKRADYILLQLEIPLETVEYVTDMAVRLGKKVILNPAPMTRISDSLLSKLYLITPNQIEAEELAGTSIRNDDDLKRAAESIRSKGVEHVIITLGSKGSFVYNGASSIIPAPKVKPVDTTGAGDVFNGALITALAEGRNLSDAVLFANKAAAIAVTREGAIKAIPYRNELSEVLI